MRSLNSRKSLENLWSWVSTSIRLDHGPNLRVSPSPTIRLRLRLVTAITIAIAIAIAVTIAMAISITTALTVTLIREMLREKAALPTAAELGVSAAELETMLSEEGGESDATLKRHVNKVPAYEP